MEKYEEEGGEDSDNETDPEQLLNEWLGELDNLTVVSLMLPYYPQIPLLAREFQQQTINIK